MGDGVGMTDAETLPQPMTWWRRWAGLLWLVPWIAINLRTGFNAADVALITGCVVLVVVAIVLERYVAEPWRSHLTTALLSVLGLAAVAVLVVVLFRSGLAGLAMIGSLVWVICGVALLLIETRTVRPWRNYARLGWASSLVGFFCVVTPARDGLPVLGLIAWAGVTLLGLIWCLYYEATEPRG